LIFNLLSTAVLSECALSFFVSLKLVDDWDMTHNQPDIFFGNVAIAIKIIAVQETKIRS